MLYPALQALDHLASRQRPQQRHDSLSAFIELQLQQVVARTYDRKFPFLDALEFVPLESDVSPYAMVWAFDSYDMRGEANFAGPSARDIPRADVGGLRQKFPIHTIWSSYAWTLEEMETAQWAGVPLNQRKADACRRAMAEKEHRVILSGQAELGIPGLLTNPMVPIITLPNGDWLDPATTVDEILADLNAIYNAIWVDSQRIFRPTMYALPTLHLRQLQTRRMGAGDGTLTVLKFFQETNPGVNFKAMTELATASAIGGARILAYDLSPENLGAIIPMPFRQEPPQVVGFETIQPARERLGGTVIYQPMSVRYADGA